MARQEAGHRSKALSTSWLFAVGGLGGGVKAQGSGDTGMVGQGQAGQTNRALVLPAASRTAVRAR